jgi:hypothetical protein
MSLDHLKAMPDGLEVASILSNLDDVSTKLGALLYGLVDARIGYGTLRPEGCA